MKTPSYAFTNISTIGIDRRLRSKCEIGYEGNRQAFIALWDTGATGTCISSNVVQKLGMVSTGRKTILTPSGQIIVNEYLADIYLPNGVQVKDIPICDSEIGKQGLDVLIGMDIICMGDFAVTNYNGKTAFSFRIPSQKRIDFVQESNIAQLAGSHGKGKRKRK